jgi:hypothetical protein
VEIFWTDVLAELGRRLESFGHDARSREVIARAVADNGWFSERDMVLTVNALREQMLDRDKLAEWVAGYGPLPFPSPCYGSTGRALGIVMAGNIPFVGFADLLYGLFCGYKCHIHTSGKDSVGMTYVVDLLEDISPQIHIGRTIPASLDALIATGDDSTVRTLRAQYPWVRALFRGTRSSIAVLSGRETRAELELLADDIFMYNGLGCRNASLLFVPEGTDMRQIADILKTYGPINDAWRNNYLQNRALAIMENDGAVIDGGFFTLTPGDDFPLYISRINHVAYADLEVVEEWVAGHDEKLQCIVSNFYLHPATVPFGCSQRPSLMDYPDGRDVVKFLLHL